MKPHAPLSLQEKLDQARRDLARWSHIAADPDLSPAAALAARNAARSSQAAVILGEKALAYELAVNDPVAQASLMRLLGISPLLPTDS
jgi:hypothetical protein